MICSVRKKDCPGYFSGQCLSIENCFFQEEEYPKGKLVELFAGTRCISKAFEEKGYKTYSIDWDKAHQSIDWYTDISTITANDIVRKFGIPDFIWASPDCTTYSIAAISHHRIKEDNGNLSPKSEYAKFCDKVNENVIQIIKELLEINPQLIYFIENPRGGLRKMNFMKGLPRYTVTYCQYETDKPVHERRMKPTDIWTNHPEPQFKPMCKNGDNCHASAPRGSKTGTQGLKDSKQRSIIPSLLCSHIANICEEYLIGVEEMNRRKTKTQRELVADINKSFGIHCQYTECKDCKYLEYRGVGKCKLAYVADLLGEELEVESWSKEKRGWKDDK